MNTSNTYTVNFAKAVGWLKEVGKIKLDKDLIEKLGWDKSNFSSVLNGKKRLPMGKMVMFLKSYPFDNFEKEDFTPAKDFKGAIEITESTNTLLNLAESNRVLANSNLVFAEAHKRIADTNAELTMMLKASLTAGAEVKNQLDGPSNLDKVLEAVAVVLTGKRMATKEAVEQVLRTIVYGGNQKLAEADTYHE